MGTLIKQIRTYLKLSQAQLAEKLSVSFQTVNRWENGKAVPNRAAQTIIYNLCKENRVPVYDFLMEKIAAAAKNIPLENGRVLLYHGSKSGLHGDIAPISRSQCDFGKGFYMGTHPSQALTLICDYEASKFYIVSIDMNKLACLEVSADIEWAMIVAYNRGRMEKIKGTPFFDRYSTLTADKDLIIGNIANDRMFYVIDSFFTGVITDKALVNSLSALQLGKQYVAVTKHGCDSVRIECEIPLSYLERLVMKDIAEENRAKGVSLAGDICKKYRREGKFFDEIIDEALKGV